MTRLALLTIVALILTALPSRSALPPPEAGIGPVPFRPERFHDFRNDEPVATEDEWLGARAPVSLRFEAFPGWRSWPCERTNTAFLPASYKWPRGCPPEVQRLQRQ